MRRAAALFCLALTMGACSNAKNARPTPSATATPTPLSAKAALEPAIELTYPTRTSQLTSGEVIVAVTVRSVSIVDKIGKPAKRGEGHVIFYLDEKVLPTRTGKPAVTEDGRSKRVAGTSYRWKHVKAGRHRFSVQLVNNDDTPLDPPVTDSVVASVRS